MSDLTDLTVTELVEAYSNGATTPVEVVEASLRRCAAIDEDIGAILTLEADRALERAAESTSRWRSGRPRPLEGVPYGLKDIVSTAEVRTTGGSHVYEDYVPAESATVEDRLAAAGGVRIAKLQTFEFACGGNSATRNPWDLERWPSGSSSGSAVAVAAREMPLAIGTDTGGSIAIPAGLCGVTGLKPTFGRVPRSGVMALSWTLDHVGPIARSASDAALVLGQIAGHDSRDPTSSSAPVPDYGRQLAAGLAGLRVGVPRDWFFDFCHPEIRSTVDSAVAVLASEGCEINEIRFPSTASVDLHALELMIIYGELASLHGGRFDHRKPYGPEFRRLLIRAQFTTAADYLQALRARHLIQADFERAFDDVDLLIAPAVVYSTPRLDNLVADVGDDVRPLADIVARTTAIFNLAGVPTLTVPGGFSTDGMPIGIQFAARPHADALCLRAGYGWQQLTDYHTRIPTAVDRRLSRAGTGAGDVAPVTTLKPVVTTTQDDLW